MISRELLRQVFAFGCVGLMATAIHYTVALFFIEVAAISTYFANILGYCSAVLVSLFGHSILTYKKKVDNLVAQRFILVSITTLIASEVILYTLESFFVLNHRISMAFVVLTVPVVTFFLNKFWVYSTPHR